MAEQVLIQFRADKALKQEVAEIYESIGMDMPTAFRMFMIRSKMVRGLPFDARLPAEKPAAAPLTKEEQAGGALRNREVSSAAGEAGN